MTDRATRSDLSQAFGEGDCLPRLWQAGRGGRIPLMRLNGEPGDTWRGKFRPYFGQRIEVRTEHGDLMRGWVSGAAKADGYPVEFLAEEG